MDSAAETRLRLRVVPNASKAEVVGWMDDDCLKVKVTAPPEGGRANLEVCALLAKVAGLSKRDVRLVRGEKSRLKEVILVGALPDILRKPSP